MPNYRRAFVPGGCWFFTANLLDRRSSLLTDQIEALREATRRARERHPFHIDAFVVLPDHIHAIWTLPEGDADFSMRWRLIKIVFRRSLELVADDAQPACLSRCRLASAYGSIGGKAADLVARLM
jgi:putative transposase